VKTGRGNRKCFGIAFRGDVTGTPGTPIESFSVLFQRFSHFGKPVFCDVSRVSELRELVSGSSARKGVEVQVLSSALVIFGVSRYRGKPRFFCVSAYDQLTFNSLVFHSTGIFDLLNTTVGTEIDFPTL